MEGCICRTSKDLGEGCSIRPFVQTEAILSVYCASLDKNPEKGGHSNQVIKKSDGSIQERANNFLLPTHQVTYGLAAPEPHPDLLHPPGRHPDPPFFWDECRDSSLRGGELVDDPCDRA